MWCSAVDWDDMKKDARPVWILLLQHHMERRLIFCAPPSHAPLPPLPPLPPHHRHSRGMWKVKGCSLHNDCKYSPSADGPLRRYELRATVLYCTGQQGVCGVAALG